MTEEKKIALSDAFKVLIRKQDRTLATFANAITNFKKLGQARMTDQAAEQRLQYLKDQLKESKEFDAQLFVLASDDVKDSHLYFVNDRFNQGIEDYHEACSYLQGFLVSRSAPVLDTSLNASRQSESRADSKSIARLPRVELPRFDGEIREWEHFRDRFESLIIQDSSLSDADRMHYLTSALKGKALKSVAHLRVTAANFPTAWKILTDEYEDKRELTISHLKTLISLPAIVRHSPESYSELRTRLITAVQSLRNLERSPDTCFDLVILLATEQFDPETKREWNFKLSEHSNYPSFDDLLKFLHIYAKVGAAPVSANPKVESNKQTGSNRKPYRLVSHIGVASKTGCILCHSNHLLFQCDAFRALTVENRFKLIKENKRCINCFSPKHILANCTNKYRCQECSGLHHTLLHKGELKLRSPLNIEKTASTSLSNETSSHLLSRSGGSDQVLLPTARVKIYSFHGRTAVLRAILDPGSQATLLSERAAQLLQLPRASLLTQVTSVGQLHVKSHAATCMGIGTVDSLEPLLSVDTIIVSSLTRYAPGQFTSRADYPHLSNLNLADAPLSSAPFDVILGSNICSMLLRPGIVQTNVNEPAALNTVFGWVVFGNTQAPSVSLEVSVNHLTMSSLHSDIQRFWEIEEIPEPCHLTPEEEQCEQHFLNSHTRRADGRYVVRLPFKQSFQPPSRNSRFKAIKCLEHLRHRLDRDVEAARAYDEFMRVYLELGHMERVPDNELQSNSCLYIPHHGVYKRNGDSPQLRVVFNASSRTALGRSLNDYLLAGPKLQNDLASIILRWRQFRFVLISDISKMFRQIMVDRRDVDFQRILWKSSSSDSISEYRLMTVTYGTTCAPYLALRIIQQLTLDEGSQYPLALPIIHNQRYMDDFLFGGDTIPQVVEQREQLTALLEKGGFTLSKWSGNHPSLLKGIDVSDQVIQFDEDTPLSSSLKVLGIVWRPIEDVFSFKVALDANTPMTKRSILSTIARLYDPLGWLAPVTVKAKIIMQQLWQSQVGWDEEIPLSLKDQWSTFYSQLGRLSDVSIRRWTDLELARPSTEIHGFADASISAYAAVVYLKGTSSSGEIVTRLLIGKSKVAPLQTVSLPRLELCAALLLARLVSYVRSSLFLPNVRCFCWSDSTIALAWIAQPSTRWKTFVANRVAKIQELSSEVQWRHVSSQDNSADCASRGVLPEDLLNHTLWWSGPDWLRRTSADWPRPVPGDVKLTTPEERSNCNVHLAVVTPPWDLQSRFSSWDKLLRISAYILRFVKIIRSKQQGHDLLTQTFLEPEEIQRAKIFWIKQIQGQLFSEELPLLSKDRPVQNSSRLAALVPFLDQDGIIRVRGRLNNTTWAESKKHPIILSSHPLVRLLIKQVHLRLLHSGPQLTLSSLRNEFWLLRARPLVRSVLFECVTCVRHSAKVPEELMGELPHCRVVPGSKAFLHTGLDYAGPLLVRALSGRGYKSHKAYISIFICMTTKALHLELVSDLTTAAFLSAFTRFISRRGSPTDMYSDNGTTFHGAHSELTTVHKTLISDPSFRNRETLTNIKWHFLPPRAPHFGGLWEAAVRSVKRHLVRCVGQQTLCIEEMMTLLCRIEGCLNSRPIGPLSDSIDDYSVLTPGHFLVGAPLTILPEPSVMEIAENRLSRWQLVQQISESFWKAWTNDYLHVLQRRTKWRSCRALIRVGQIVLLRDSSAPPSHWLLGRIVACHPGQDGLTRVVTLKTATSSFKRSINQICLLPISINQADQDAAKAGGTH